jgi:D-alanine--poly(phosphoribitol) ligase subunit 2
LGDFERERVVTTAEVVLSELERITGTDQVRKDLDLALFDEDVLDSLGTVELIVALGEKLDISISPAQINRQQWASPRKIIAFVEEKAGA